MRNLFPPKYRIPSHILFWLCVFGLFIFTAMIKGSDLKHAAILNMALLPFDMIGAYFTIYFLIPRFLFTRKYYIFFPAFIIFTVVYGMFIVTPAEYYIITTYLGADKWGSPLIFMPNRLLWTLVILLMINGLAASVKITKHWLISLQVQHALEKKMIETELKLREAELQYLKSQIHPHFLFNTLNNLYGLTLQKSDLAPEVVVKLSEMLDFMLYEGNKSLIPLEQEVKLLQNYVGLEKLRHDESLHTDQEINIGNSGIEIAPFLLLAFAENAFKHGAAKGSGEKYIKIKLETADNHLLYEVSNTCDPNENHDPAPVKEGIGLKNLRKRLELQYNGNFELTFLRKNTKFTASLSINMNSNNK